MPSVHRMPGSKNWFAAILLPDGRRTFRKTGTTNRTKAMGVALLLDRAGRLARERRLTEAAVRQHLAEFYAMSNEDALPSSTTEQFFASWLKTKSLEVADSSYVEYERISKEFIRHLGAKSKQPLDLISAADVSRFRSALAERVRGGTVNKTLKILRGAFSRAMREGLCQANPFARIELVRTDRSERRPFTMDEVRRILASTTGEWRGLILAGIYTGQRLSDVAGLRWRNVDLAEQEIRFTTQKTRRPMVLPIAGPLLRYLMAQRAPDDPEAPVFPLAAAAEQSTLSRQFGDILADSGLVPKRPHAKKAKGDGRSGRRSIGGLSFHCLRHSLTSWLKTTGTPDAVAREIVGHDSEAVSRIYTHVGSDALFAAINRLPDITATPAPVVFRTQAKSTAMDEHHPSQK